MTSTTETSPAFDAALDRQVWRARLRAVWNSPWLLALLAASLGHILAVHALYITDALRNGDLIATGEAFIYAEEFLFQVPLFLGIAALFMRQVGARALMLITIVSFLANNIDLIDYHLHNLLDHLDLYPAYFRHGVPDGPVNVQLAILLCYAIVYPLVWLSVLIPSRRTVPRSFVLLIMTATLGTTTLFHELIVNNALVTTLDQERLLNREYLARIIDVPDEASFMTLCQRAGVDCLAADIRQLPELGPPAMGKRIQDTHWAAIADDDRPVSTHVEALITGALDADLRGNQFAYHRDGERYRLAVDMTSYNHLPARYKIYFGALMITAHFWWVYGGFALLAFHRSRFSWRFARKQQAETAGAG